MRVLVTGGSGVLGRHTLPLLRHAGHVVTAPSRDDLDLFDASAVAEAVRPHDAVLHLATRIPPPDQRGDAGAWVTNDRLRAEASRLLVDAALASEVQVYVQPTVAFVYPVGATVDEDTPIRTVTPHLVSAVTAEQHTKRFAGAGRRGVVLRLGLLDGPGTGSDDRVPVYGATLYAPDAGAALALALHAPSGIYNVCRDGERVSNARFRQTTGWAPTG